MQSVVTFIFGFVLGTWLMFMLFWVGPKPNADYEQQLRNNFDQCAANFTQMKALFDDAQAEVVRCRAAFIGLSNQQNFNKP